MQNKFGSSSISNYENIIDEVRNWQNEDELEIIQTALASISHQTIRDKGVQALFDAFSGPVSPRAKSRLRASFILMKRRRYDISSMQVMSDLG